MIAAACGYPDLTVDQFWAHRLETTGACLARFIIITIFTIFAVSNPEL
jgi:hypothetical protein